MVKTVLVLAAAAASSVMIAGPASAATVRADGATAPAARSHWGPWTAIPVAKPFAFNACGTRIQYRDYIQHEQSRTRTLPGGNTAIETRGRYVAMVTDLQNRKRTAIVDASGESLAPNYSIAYKNGDYLFRGTGANIVAQPWPAAVVAATGLPRAFVSTGLIAILYHRDSDGQPLVDVVSRPRQVTNICGLLK